MIDYNSEEFFQEWHNKAGRPDYNPSPFFYWDDTVADCPRIVAWSQDCRQIREGFLALLDSFPQSIDVLFKVRTKPIAEHGYDRWHGIISLNALRQAVDEFAYYVFQYGYQVLCVLDTETDEYVALDDFGMLWFYTRSKDGAKILEQHGFTHQKNALVTEGGCYVAGNQDQLKWQEAFIARLGLEQVY